MSCVAEIPGLVQVAEKYRDQGGAVLLVSYDLQLPENDAGQIAGQVRRFVEARQWGLPVYIAQAASIGAIDEHFELPGPIPVTLALDKDGRIVDRQEGEAEPARFEEMMRKALGL